jgi:hypothetical protein
VREVDPIITNDKYGRLLTVYMPVKDAAGKTVAYAGADIDMKQFVQDMRIFIIKMLAMAFGITMLMCALAIWYADRSLSGLSTPSWPRPKRLTRCSRSTGWKAGNGRNASR